MIHILWCAIRPTYFTSFHPRWIINAENKSNIKTYVCVNTINMNVRICSYRNCNNDISNMRTNAKFCCRNHKSYEKLYKLREKIKKGAQ